MKNLTQFIEDFKTSPIFKGILNDNAVEPIMIWVSGSVLTGSADSSSDYDVCILVKNIPQDDPNSPWTIYGRPGSYFMWYKPQSKKVEWIYTDINDIISASTVTPLVNSGWAQIKFLSEEAIIYKNQKYLDFINTLFEKKEDIFRNSLYLFIKSAQYHTINGKLEELIYEDPSQPNKLLAHICLVAELLQNKEINTSNLLTIKRTIYSQLSQEIRDYILNAIKYLEAYLLQVDEENLPKIDLWKILEENNL